MRAHGAKANESAAKARGETIAQTQESTARATLERIKKRAVKYIVAAGAKGLTRSETSSKLGRDKKYTKDAIQLALEGGYIAEVKREKTGKPLAEKVTHYIAGETKP
jgi:hypothetical protein